MNSMSFHQPSAEIIEVQWANNNRGSDFRSYSDRSESDIDRSTKKIDPIGSDCVPTLFYIFCLKKCKAATVKVESTPTTVNNYENSTRPS